MRSRKLRVGVVGCGLIARRAHLPAFTADGRASVVAACSGHRSSAEAVAAEFGVPTVHDRWQELVNDRNVDAVDICAPNALHAPIAIAAARAGKHVLVEKPMALSVADADAMIDAADRAGVVLMVSHNLRYTPLFSTLYDVVHDGTIGRLFSARGVFMHAGPDEFWGATSEWFWDKEQAGGGALLDMGIHMIDLLRWCLGDQVVEVSAMTSRMEKPTFADDNALVLLRFAGGAIASMQASWTARPFPDRELVIYGERGHASVGRSPVDPIAVHIQDDGPHTARQVKVEVPATSRLRSPFAHFVSVVREGVQPLTSGKEGRETLLVTLAAYEAARSGRVITLVQ